MFYFGKKIIKILGIIFFIFILIFIYNRYARIRSGPKISSINIQEYMSVKSPSLELHGQGENIENIFINGRPLILKERNIFDEILVFSPGLNIIEVLLEDAFHKKKKYTYHIFYQTEKTDYPITLSQAKKEQKEKMQKDKALNQ